MKHREYGTYVVKLVDIYDRSVEIVKILKPNKFGGGFPVGIKLSAIAKLREVIMDPNDILKELLK